MTHFRFPFFRNFTFADPELGQRLRQEIAKLLGTTASGRDAQLWKKTATFQVTGTSFLTHSFISHFYRCAIYHFFVILSLDVLFLDSNGYCFTLFLEIYQHFLFLTFYSFTTSSWCWGLNHSLTCSVILFILMILVVFLPELAENGVYGIPQNLESHWF